MIAIDFSMLSKTRTQRCAYQLTYLALIAGQMGLPIKAIVTKSQIAEHPILQRIKHMWSYDHDNIDVYIAKSDTFFYDDNYSHIVDLPAFKVCLCTSDRTFREGPHQIWNGRPVGPIQDRCDLYMPVNYTNRIVDEYGYKTVPIAHPIMPAMFDLFVKMHLDDAFLNDDVAVIRSAFKQDTTGLAGFMGARRGYARAEAVAARMKGEIPNWVELAWETSASPKKYLEFLLSKRACVDLRGNGDKNIRFTEAVLFGRTIIAKPVASQYYPPLADGYNAIIVREWSELHTKLDLDLWSAISKRATGDYVNWWSQRAQLQTMLRRSGYGGDTV